MQSNKKKHEHYCFTRDYADSPGLIYNRDRKKNEDICKRVKSVYVTSFVIAIDTSGVLQIVAVL